MLQQQPHSLWQANYKSMSPTQLVSELEQISKDPHRFDETTSRITFLAHELALRKEGPTIILME